MSGKQFEGASRRAILIGAGAAVGAAALAYGTKGASAAGYPDHTVKIIVPFAPSGPTDIMARIVSVHLGEALGGSVIVDNRAGAGGNIGMGAAARAEPDGYTLLITSSALVVNPGLYAKVPYDPFKDFASIGELGTSPNVFLANPKVAINSISDLVARAKANPSELNYGSPGIGTTPHLSGEEHVRQSPEFADRCEILEGIIGYLGVETGVDDEGTRGDQQSVAIRLRPSRRTHADIASGAPPIVDDHRTTESLAEVDDNSRHDVRWSGWRKGHTKFTVWSG